MANAGGRRTTPLLLEPEEREYLASSGGAVDGGAVPDHPALRGRRSEQGGRGRVGCARPHGGQ